MNAAKEINQIAEDLGNKIQEKHLNEQISNKNRNKSIAGSRKGQTPNCL